MELLLVIAFLLVAASTVSAFSLGSTGAVASQWTSRARSSSKLCATLEDGNRLYYRKRNYSERAAILGLKDTKGDTIDRVSPKLQELANAAALYQSITEPKHAYRKSMGYPNQIVKESIYVNVYAKLKKQMNHYEKRVHS